MPLCWPQCLSALSVAGSALCLRATIAQCHLTVLASYRSKSLTVKEPSFEAIKKKYFNSNAGQYINKDWVGLQSKLIESTATQSTAEQ